MSGLSGAFYLPTRKTYPSTPETRSWRSQGRCSPDHPEAPNIRHKEPGQLSYYSSHLRASPGETTSSAFLFSKGSMAFGYSGICADGSCPYYSTGIIGTGSFDQSISSTFNRCCRFQLVQWCAPGGAPDYAWSRSRFRGTRCPTAGRVSSILRPTSLYQSRRATSNSTAFATCSARTGPDTQLATR